MSSPQMQSTSASSEVQPSFEACHQVFDIAELVRLILEAVDDGTDLVNFQKTRLVFSMHVKNFKAAMTCNSAVMRSDITKKPTAQTKLNPFLFTMLDRADQFVPEQAKNLLGDHFGVFLLPHKLSRKTWPTMDEFARALMSAWGVTRSAFMKDCTSEPWWNMFVSWPPTSVVQLQIGNDLKVDCHHPASQWWLQRQPERDPLILAIKKQERVTIGDVVHSVRDSYCGVHAPFAVMLGDQHITIEERQLGVDIARAFHNELHLGYVVLPTGHEMPYDEIALMDRMSEVSRERVRKRQEVKQ